MTSFDPLRVTLTQGEFLTHCAGTTLNEQLRSLAMLTVRKIAGASLSRERDKVFDCMCTNGTGTIFGLSGSPNTARLAADCGGYKIHVPVAQLTFDKRKHARPVHHIMIGMFMQKPTARPLFTEAPDVYVAGWINYEELDGKRKNGKPPGFGGQICWPVRGLRPMPELLQLLARSPLKTPG